MGYRLVACFWLSLIMIILWKRKVSVIETIYKESFPCFRVSVQIYNMLLMYYDNASLFLFELQIVVPPLPSKALKRQLPFRSDDGIYEETFIEERRSNLEAFVNKWESYQIITCGLWIQFFLSLAKLIN